MPTKLPLTFACGDNEIVRPLISDEVEVDGVDLTILTDMDSATRHWRFLRNHEFDVAEVSSSSYLAARDRDWPFRAIPVFLHRRFRHGFMFINTTKGITKPTDLIGRKIGVKTLMTSAVLWMRGILQHEYGVPLESIEWFAELDDDVGRRQEELHLLLGRDHDLVRGGEEDLGVGVVVRVGVHVLVLPEELVTDDAAGLCTY